MSDSIDITMEAVVAQYREEVTSIMGEKLMLQAAVKILGDRVTEMQSQIRQLTEDLGTAVDDNARLTEALEQAEHKVSALDAALEDVSLPLRPLPINPNQHIPYQLGSNDVGD